MRSRFSKEYETSRSQFTHEERRLLDKCKFASHIVHSSLSKATRGVMNGAKEFYKQNKHMDFDNQSAKLLNRNDEDKLPQLRSCMDILVKHHRKYKLGKAKVNDLRKVMIDMDKYINEGEPSSISDGLNDLTLWITEDGHTGHTTVATILGSDDVWGDVGLETMHDDEPDPLTQTDPVDSVSKVAGAADTSVLKDKEQEMIVTGGTTIGNDGVRNVGLETIHDKPDPLTQNYSVDGVSIHAGAADSGRGKESELTSGETTVCVCSDTDGNTIDNSFDRANKDAVEAASGCINKEKIQAIPKSKVPTQVIKKTKKGRRAPILPMQRSSKRIKLKNK